MNVAQTANDIYRAIKDNAQASAKIRAEFTSLAVLIATDPNASARVTSATVNGQSFSAQPTMTQGQRLQMLRRVVAYLDNCGPISTTQATSF